MKRIFTFLFLAVLAVTLIGCNNDEKDPDKNGDDFTATEINTILSTGKNNDEVQVEGVVYGVLNNGFYVVDSKGGKIFVTIPANSEIEVTVGDKLQITGQYGLVNNFPQLKNVDVDIVESGVSVDVAAVDGDIELISKLDPNEKIDTYGKVVNLEATIGQNAARMITLTDDEGHSVVVYQSSNLAALEAKMNKRVNITVIVHNYFASENTWLVSFVGESSDVVESVLEFDDVVEMALEDLTDKVPAEIYGTLSLPTEHPVHSFIKYKWSVDKTNHLTINSNGTVRVSLDTVDHDVTFTVEITDGTNSATHDFKVVSKGIVERSVSELLNDLPEISMSFVHVKGVVVGITRNQSLSLRSYVIQDPETLETTTVDFSNSGNYILNNSEKFQSVSIGDVISVEAKYRLTGRQTIMHVSDFEIISSNNQYTHDFENAFVLNDEASYLEFAENYEDFNNKLIKFENPFLNFSTASTPTDTNWVVLGHDKLSGLSGFNTGGMNRRLAFLIAAQNESLGDDSWYSTLDIAPSNQDAKQIDGSIYAYAVYVSDAYIAFIIPDWTAWSFEEDLVIERDLGLEIPATSTGGKMDLVTNHELIEGEISWSSTNVDVIDPVTGTIATVDEITIVTLTATYKYKGITKSLSFDVVVQPERVLTVTELTSEIPNNIFVNVTGLIVGYSSDGNNNSTRDGIIILDPVTGEMVLVNAMANVYTGAAYGNYLDSTGQLLAIGDEVTISGIYYTDAPAIGAGKQQKNRKHITITTDSVVTKLSSENELTFNYEDAIVIDSHEAQQDLADDLQYGKLIKFVGTEENPFFIGGSTSNPTDDLNLKVFFNEATNNDGTKYNGQTFVLKSNVNEPNAGPNWLEDLFGVTENFVGPTPSSARIPIIGEVYVVVTALTNTYIQMSIVDVASATTIQA